MYKFFLYVFFILTNLFFPRFPFVSGPFLTTLFNRLENFTNNCFYANLYLTNLISSLASYPIPLLRAILFLTNTTQFAQSMAAATNTQHFNTQTFRAINDNVLYYLPYNILCLIKEQIELFTVLYTRQVKYFGSLDTLNGYSFDELKQEARRYLNCETIDLSKLSISMDTSTIPLGVEKKKKKLKGTNISHKESKTFTTDKQNISPSKFLVMIVFLWVFAVFHHCFFLKIQNYDVADMSCT